MTGKEADKQQSKAGAWVKAASSELGRCAGRVIIYGVTILEIQSMKFFTGSSVKRFIVRNITIIED